MSATRKIGAVAVPLNYRLTPEEALYVINHSDAVVAYVDYEYAPMFAAFRGQLDKVRHVIAVGGPPRMGCWATRISRPRGWRTRRRRRVRRGRDDDLHLRYDRQAEGRGPERPPGSGRCSAPC